MKKTIKLIFLTLFIWMMFSAFSIVNAASATIKANKTTATVGDSVKVTVTVNAAAWNLKVSGSATGDIIGYNSEAENQTTTKTYTIDTSKAGTYKVTLSGDITDEAKDTADTINTSVSVTVKAKETTTDKKEDTTTDKSTSTTNKDTTSATNKETTTSEKPKEKSKNAYLSTLGVTPKEYDFSGFSKNKTEYSVTVPKNVDSLKVLYKTADSNAKVSVSGNSGFKVGSDNKITIKVTAEDGKTTKNYIIKVTQLAEEEEKPGNVIENEERLYLETLSIEGIDLSPEFAKDIFSYTAILSDYDVNELKVEAKANTDKAIIDISGDNNLVEGENTINIVLKMEDSTVQTVYQIVVTKETSEDTTILTPEVDDKNGTTDLIGKLKSYAGIAIGVIILIVIAVIVLIVLLIRENKRINEEGEFDEEVEDSKVKEYNVYENDENEFLNNEVQKDNFIESLYNQRNGNIEQQELTEEQKETLEEISRQTEKIFEEKVAGQSVEYVSNDTVENPLATRKRRRGKGKHSL